jgi:6,7-dimethyl-8-ribityllumazine synthase
VTRRRRETWPGERDAPDGDGQVDHVEQFEEIEQAEPPDPEGEAVAEEPAAEEPVAEAAPAVDEPAAEPVEPSAEVGRDGSEPDLAPAGHAPEELELPDDVDVLEGEPRGGRRGVGIVAARFNGEITNRLLESALAELERAGVGRDAVTVMAVPGAFELPLGAMALAKTRRYSCIVALGCVIRGETAHFEYVAGEAASGLQLAALETGIPVAFGVLTVDTLEQALARVDKGAETVRTGLEMADLFSQLRETARAK